jgi:hypothetical protein
VLHFGVLEPVTVQVRLRATTPGVHYDRPNPVELVYGEALTVTASKPGYQSKTLTLAAVRADQVLDFQELDRIPPLPAQEEYTRLVGEINRYNQEVKRHNEALRRLL